MFIKLKDLELRKMEFDENFSPGVVDLGEEVAQRSPLRAIGRAELVRESRGARQVVEDIRLVGNFSTEIEVRCARCLDPVDDIVSGAFDLIYRGLEIASGTQRVHVPALLIQQLKSKGLNPENFRFYVDSFRYGAPPHAGWSIGLERLTMKVTGRENIRETTMFPRDRNRLSP